MDNSGSAHRDMFPHRSRNDEDDQGSLAFPPLMFLSGRPFETFTPAPCLSVTTLQAQNQQSPDPLNLPPPPPEPPLIDEVQLPRSGFGLGLTSQTLPPEHLDTIRPQPHGSSDFGVDAQPTAMPWLAPPSDWTGGLFRASWMPVLGQDSPSPPPPPSLSVPRPFNDLSAPYVPPLAQTTLRPFNPVPVVIDDSRSSSPAVRVEAARAPSVPTIPAVITPFVPYDTHIHQRSETPSSSCGVQTPTFRRSIEKSAPSSRLDKCFTGPREVRVTTPLKPFHPDIMPWDSPLLRRASSESISMSQDQAEPDLPLRVGEQGTRTPGIESETQSSDAGLAPRPEETTEEATPESHSIPEEEEPIVLQEIRGDVAPEPPEEPQIEQQSASLTPVADLEQAPPTVTESRPRPQSGSRKQPAPHPPLPDQPRAPPATEVVALPRPVLFFVPPTSQPLEKPVAAPAPDLAYRVATSDSDAFVLLTWLRSQGSAEQHRLVLRTRYLSAVRASVETDRLMTAMAANALVDAPYPRGFLLARSLARLETMDIEQPSSAPAVRRLQRRQASSLLQRTVRRSRSVPCPVEPIDQSLLVSCSVSVTRAAEAQFQPQLRMDPALPLVVASAHVRSFCPNIRVSLHRFLERWRETQYREGCDRLPLSGLDRRFFGFVQTWFSALNEASTAADDALCAMVVEQERVWRAQGVSYLSLVTGKLLSDAELRSMHRRVPLERVPTLRPLALGVLPPTKRPRHDARTATLLAEQRKDRWVPPASLSRYLLRSPIRDRAQSFANAVIQSGLTTHRSVSVPPVERNIVEEACKTPTLREGSRRFPLLAFFSAIVSSIVSFVLVRVYSVVSLAVLLLRLVLLALRIAVSAPCVLVLSFVVAVALPWIVGYDEPPPHEYPELINFMALPPVTESFSTDAWLTRVDAMAGLAVFDASGLEQGRTVVRSPGAIEPVEFGAPSCTQQSEEYTRRLFNYLVSLGLTEPITVTQGLAQAVSSALCTDGHDLELAAGQQRFVMRRRGDVVRVAVQGIQADQSLQAAAQSSVNARRKARNEKNLPVVPEADEFTLQQWNESRRAARREGDDANGSTALPELASQTVQSHPLIVRRPTPTAPDQISNAAAFFSLALWFFLLFCCRGLSLSQVAAIFSSDPVPPAPPPFAASSAPLLLCPPSLLYPPPSFAPFLSLLLPSLTRALRVYIVIRFSWDMVMTPRLKMYLALPLARRVCVNAVLALATVDCGHSERLRSLGTVRQIFAWLTALLRLAFGGGLALVALWLFAAFQPSPPPLWEAVSVGLTFICVTLGLVWSALALHGSDVSLSRVLRGIGISAFGRFLGSSS